MQDINSNRDFMKSGFKEDAVSDQSKGIVQPPLEKPFVAYIKVIDLVKVDEKIVKNSDIHNCIMNRKSNRKHLDAALSLEELGYLLWTTEGVKEIRGNQYATIRPVPSAGARHPFETYLAVNNVEGLEKGIYRYSGISHQLYFLLKFDDIETKIMEGTLGQKFASIAPVTFIWSCLPYRGEWRYGLRSHKAMLLDAGHVCHGLYLSCEALGLGTCAIAAYDQDFMDNLLELDGQDEFVVYMAPVGKI